MGNYCWGGTADTALGRVQFEATAHTPELAVTPFELEPPPPPQPPNEAINNRSSKSFVALMLFMQAP